MRSARNVRYISPFGWVLLAMTATAALLVLIAMVTTPVQAQALPSPSQGGNIILSVTTSEGTPTALPAVPGTFPDLVVHNDGAQEVFCSAGVGTSFTVTTTSYQVAVPSKGFASFHNPTADHVACVTSTSTSTARVYQNAGAAVMGNAGG